MSSTTKMHLNSANYLQPSSSHSYDSSQSPLALLAETCSNIGKDCPSSSATISNSTPPIVTKSSSDKSFSSTKRSLSSRINPNRKSSRSLQTNSISTCSSFVDSNHLSSQSDSTQSSSLLLLRSTLAYLSSQQHLYSSICTVPGCLQCETVRYILSSSLNNQPYICHWSTCNARFCSHNELTEHIRYKHRSSKTSNHYRFYPYLKPSRMIDNNDQLPFFYPHLSLSSMTATTHHSNNNTNNNN